MNKRHNLRTVLESQRPDVVGPKISVRCGDVPAGNQWSIAIQAYLKKFKQVLSVAEPVAVADVAQDHQALEA